MTIENMKEAIKRVYDTTSWHRKVDAMYDDQVMAIYFKFSQKGILDKVLRREKPFIDNRNQPSVYKDTDIGDCIVSQIDMFNLIDKR